MSELTTSSGGYKKNDITDFEYYSTEEHGESIGPRHYELEADQTSDEDFELKEGLSQNALSFISGLEESEQTELSKNIICKTAYWASYLSSKFPNLDKLPKIRASQLEDSSILIEWAFENWRIGFGIENEIDESGWYLVSNENDGYISASGDLTKIDSRKLILWLLMFLLLTEG